MCLWPAEQQCGSLAVWERNWRICVLLWRQTYAHSEECINAYNKWVVLWAVNEDWGPNCNPSQRLCSLLGLLWKAVEAYRFHKNKVKQRRRRGQINRENVWKRVSRVKG